MVHICREKTKEAKVQLEVTLPNVVRQQQKRGFSKYVKSKKWSKENIGLIFGDLFDFKQIVT